MKQNATTPYADNEAVNQDGTTTKLQAVEIEGFDKQEAQKAQEYLDQLRKEAEPMWLTDTFIDRPCKFLLLGILAMTVISILPISLGYFSVNTGQSNRDYLIWDDQLVLNQDKYLLAQDYVKNQSGLADVPLRSETGPSMFMVFSFTGDSEYGLLQKDTLLKIQEAEAIIRGHSNFTKVCLATSNVDTSCSPMSLQSPLSFLAMAGVSDLNAYSQEQILDAYKTAMAQPSWFGVIPFYDKYFSSTNMTVSYMRTIIPLGMPLEIDGVKFRNSTHNETDQKDYLTEFAKDIRDKLDEFKTGDEFEIYFASFLLSEDEFQSLIIQDALFSVFSILFVFCYLCFHLKNGTLAAVGVLLILFSYPLTLLITEGVFRVTYLGSLQMISIYLVLGIACDDIFVFVDAWKQSAHLAPEVFQGDKKKRMAYSFRRAVRAMAVTSSTTSVAFFANIFSPVMPIKSFGVIAGFIIPINYLLVVMFMPPATVYFENKRFCCCGTKKVETEGKPEIGRIEKFFDEVWNPFVHKSRYVIVVVTLLWTAFAATQAFQMGPQTKQEEFMDPDHPVIKTYTLMMDEFHADADSKPEINFVWGVNSVDRSEESMWDPEYEGMPIFTNSSKFDPTLSESQEFLEQFCDDLQAEEWMTKDPVSCWIKTFKAYLVAQGTTFPIEDSATFVTEVETWLTSTPEGFKASAENLIGVANGKVVYIAVRAYSDFGPFDPRDEKMPIHDNFERFLEKKRGEANPEMKEFIQTSEAWTFMPTEEAFVTNAIQGIIISVLFAFVILLLASRNYIVSLISISCVIIVIISIVAIMHMNGQELGTSESIAIVILIGFSVDYTVHLATDYTHSAKEARFEKMRQAFREMGVSIFSGFITTFGCGLFLFGGNFTFFKKFGLLITSTVFFSFLAASCVFAAMCHIFGPERGMGDLGKKKAAA